MKHTLPKHLHITKQVKATTVQDIPKWNSHNIIKYPQYTVILIAVKPLRPPCEASSAVKSDWTLEIQTCHSLRQIPGSRRGFCCSWVPDNCCMYSYLSVYVCVCVCVCVLSGIQQVDILGQLFISVRFCPGRFPTYLAEKYMGGEFYWLWRNI